MFWLPLYLFLIFLYFCFSLWGLHSVLIISMPLSQLLPSSHPQLWALFCLFVFWILREKLVLPHYPWVCAVDLPAPPLLEKTASPSPSSCHQQLTARQNMICTASFSTVGFELRQTLLVLNQNQGLKLGPSCRAFACASPWETALPSSTLLVHS